MGVRQYGIDPKRITEYAQDIKKIVEQGVQVAIVIGGGNIFRGLSGANNGMERVQGDHMGMLATIINGLALQSALENEKIETRLQSEDRCHRIGTKKSVTYIDFETPKTIDTKIIKALRSKKNLADYINKDPVSLFLEEESE